MVRPLRSPVQRPDPPVAPLRVVLDIPTISDSESLDVIEALTVRHPEVEIWRTTQSAENWIEVTWDQVQNDCFLPILHRRDEASMTTLKPASTWRLFATQLATDSLAEEEALRQLGLAQISADNNFALFVTDSEQLLTAPFQLGARIDIRSSREAASLVSLHLRSSGRYELGSPSPYGGRFWFYVIGSRAVLPASSAWFSACQLSTGAGEDVLSADDEPASLRALGQTTMERIDWTLRARDMLLFDSGADVVPFDLDTFLFQLSGAFDAAAQAITKGLGLSGSPGWRKRPWRDRLTSRYPTFEEVLSPESEHYDAIEILSLPRNTIHDGGMPRLDIQEGMHRPPRVALRIPRGRYAPRLLAAIERRGGPERWGFQPVIPGTTVIDPLVFVERCLVAGLGALNALMDATPIEEFPQVQVEQLRHRTWSDRGPSDPWSEWSKRRILLLLGLLDDISTFS